jgi:NhaA family Na+:H+ antiporter
MATGIAFALGVLALLGPRVPVALKVFLTAVAILDDIGAVVVIAAFYSEGIELWPLAVATVLIGISAILNLLGFRNALPYGVLGVLVWLVLLRSGVHTTIGGVLLALTMPSRRRIDPEQFAVVAHRLVDGYRARQAASPAAHDEGHELTELIEVCHRVQNPLQRFEHALLPWTVFFIMPVFALANAGVPLEAGLLRELAQPVTLGILLGLVVGKPLGILATCWLGVRLRIASLPDGVRWGHLLAVGCLCGIGFTMSLFIASLGFAAADLERQARLGVLAASLVAAVLGAVCMRFTAPLPPRP